MLKPSLVFVCGVMVAACGSDALRQQPVQPSTPKETDTDPLPEPAEPCMFYGVDEIGTLWVIDPASPSGPKATAVGDTGVPKLTDLAIDEDGVIWAMDRRSLYYLSGETGAATLFMADVFADWEEPVAAGALPGRKLLLGASRDLKVLDLDTGALEERGALGGSSTFSGDFAVIDATTAFGTVRAGQFDDLYVLSLEDGVARRLGSVGHRKVWGLDYGCDDRLYGLVSADPPRLLVIDFEGSTPVVEDLGTFSGPTSLWGAAGPGPF